jgi:hypothetical protein
LTLEAEGRGSHTLDRGIQIRLLIDDDGILAAHLGHHPLEPDLSGLNLGRQPVDPDAHFLGTGKRDKTCLRVTHQRIADGPAASGEEVQHTGGEPHLLHELVKLVADARRIARGLEHDRVAADDGGRRHPDQNRQREVPRRDDHTDPERQIRDRIPFARELNRIGRLIVAQHLAGVVLNEVDRLGGVAIGFRPALADLEDHPGREVIAPLTHPLGRFDQIGSTLGRGYCRPRGEGLERHLDRPVCQLGCTRLETSHDLRRTRRILGLESLSTRDVLSPDDDGVLPADLTLHLGQSLFEGFADLGLREIEVGGRGVFG